MKSLWNEREACNFFHDPLALRVYASRLLGQETDLVMHGGGNTSVKAQVLDFFGTKQQVLYIKGSGWDLATIEPKGFAAVKMDVLLRMAAMERLSDTDMVRQQRAAMLDPNAPSPSVEAILHAIIPYTYVDHSHADAVVTISNTPDGRKRIEGLYGRRMLIVPYVMPGFLLARKVYEMTRGMDWSRYEGMVLLNHGLFTFADTPQESYEKHIHLVTRAERYIKRVASRKAKGVVKRSILSSAGLLSLAHVRQAVSRIGSGAVVALFKDDSQSVAFSRLPNVKSLAVHGTLTPDHVIRTKPQPLIISHHMEAAVHQYARAYRHYFERHTDGKLKCLDLAPRWAVWPGHGVVAFGRSLGEAGIVSDIVDHTIQAMQRADVMGGWRALKEKDLFEVEYWELEQAKLSKNPKPLSLQGKIAIVTGSASGIGKACVEHLQAQGVYVNGLDIKDGCDVTKESDVQRAVESAVRRYGGVDIIVSNAGIFPPSLELRSMDQAVWEKSMKVNLTSHQLLVKAAVPYLSLGIDPTIILVGSKNVPAPGPGAGAYSIAKAGLTQLGRVAALELGTRGIRVNIIHPNQVFDTAIWTREVLKKRARHYGLSVEEYKTNNILHTEITSHDVAELICAMAGGAFAKTTGAQIPIDGGNDRVI